MTDYEFIASVAAIATVIFGLPTTYIAFSLHNKKKQQDLLNDEYVKLNDVQNQITIDLKINAEEHKKIVSQQKQIAHAQLITNTLEPIREWANETIFWNKKAEYLLKTYDKARHSDFVKEANEICTHISIQVDRGRFFFPNIEPEEEEMKDFGKHKPLIYQGYRPVIFDFLVEIHDLLDDFSKHEEINVIDALSLKEREVRVKIVDNE